MTKLSDRPPDCCCEGCWDARPVPGLEKDYYLCDYHGSPDYGHIVHYRHACQCFSIGDRGEELFLTPAAVRLEAGVTPEQAGLIGKGGGRKPSDFNPGGWLKAIKGIFSRFGGKYGRIKED